MANSVEKRTIAQFVHDAVEMETAIYTLNQMEDNQRQRKSKLIYDSEQQLKNANSEYYEYYEKAEKARKELDLFRSKEPDRATKKEKQKTGSILLWLFCREEYKANLFLLLYLYVIFSMIVSLPVFIVSYYLGFDLSDYYLFAISMIITAVIMICVNCKNRIKEQNTIIEMQDENNRLYNRTLMRLEKNYKNDLAEAKKHEKTINQAKAFLQKTKNDCVMIDKQILLVSQKRASIKQNLDTLYNYGIVPPDYRFMDCVIILDQIFRNDLADTMREAIKIYEERVFRGSVIRGMDKIVSMLGQLSSDMSAISLRLDMINNNVAHMSNDLVRFNEKIASEGAKNRAVTEDLIRETQLGRYTNEKLLESNKRLEYYAEEYRMGRMPIK